MKKTIFTGCGTAIATPFDDNGVNFKELQKLIEFQISEGADALVVCGTTGESSTMSFEEKCDTIKFATQISNGRIPIIAGTGGNNTKEVIKMSKKAEELGVDALLIVTPYYNKTTQAGLVAHYNAVAKEVSLPIILYSVPSRTGVNITPETCLELYKIENIVAIKEASGNLSQIADIAHLCGDNLDIYSGNDDQILPILSLGGKGVISVLSNIYPKLTHNIVSNFLDGNLEKAKSLQLDALPLIHSLFSEVNPIPVKAGLNMIGFDFGIPRLPLVEMTENKKVVLKNEIDRLKNVD